MTRILVICGPARDDLARFSISSPSTIRVARTYVGEIEGACKRLCYMPLIGMERADLRPGLRIFPVSRRVIVAYELAPDELRVLRVFTGGRDYETIMEANRS